MRKIILISLSLVSVIFSASSFAVRTELADISFVFASADGGGLVTISSTLDTVGAVCSANGRYQIDPTGPGAKGHLATLLTAKASGAQIQMDIDDCVTFPGVSPEILNVILF